MKDARVRQYVADREWEREELSPSDIEQLKDEDPDYPVDDDHLPDDDDDDPWKGID